MINKDLAIFLSWNSISVLELWYRMVCSNLLSICRVKKNLKQCMGVGFFRAAALVSCGRELLDYSWTWEKKCLLQINIQVGVSRKILPT